MSDMRQKQEQYVKQDKVGAGSGSVNCDRCLQRTVTFFPLKCLT